MILDAPPKGWKRPAIPLRVQLPLLVDFVHSKIGIRVCFGGPLENSVRLYKAEIKQHCGAINIDHRPPLSERRFDTEANDTIPPANDIRYLEVLLKNDHDERTFGKKATTLGSDAHSRAKVRRIKKMSEPSKKPKKVWAKRKLQSRNTFKERRK